MNHFEFRLFFPVSSSNSLGHNSQFHIYSHHFLFKIITDSYQAELFLFAIVVAVEQFFMVAVLIFLYLKYNILHLTWRFSFSTAKSLLSNSWPLLLSSMSIMIYMRIDQVMINNILGSEAVGKYSAAVKISELWYFIPIAINQALLPSLIESKNNSPDQYKTHLQHLYDIMVWLSLSIAIPLYFLSEPLVQTLFGKNFFEAAGVLKIHIWSCVFVFIGVSNSSWFLVENLQIYSFYRTIIGGIINVFLNIILIPKIGINGAALSTLISQAFVGYFSMAIFTKSKNIFFLLSRSFNPYSAFKRTIVV